MQWRKLKNTLAHKITGKCEEIEFNRRNESNYELPAHSQHGQQQPKKKRIKCLVTKAGIIYIIIVLVVE